MNPVIGVTPDFHAGDRKDMGGPEPTYFLRARYIRAVEELGGIPLILPLVAHPAARRRLLDGVDGLLLTGSGPDLSPRLYGERKRYKFPIVNERRADFELEMVRQAGTRDLPLLGICGGMQTVNVACGEPLSGYSRTSPDRDGPSSEDEGDPYRSCGHDRTQEPAEKGDRK